MREQARRRELAAFLKARRAQIKPGDVGLPEGMNRRRTPGLRREEVAHLSGVGLTWYTWLEQGREIPASKQIVDALAHALRLDQDQCRHLYALAGLPTPTTESDGLGVTSTLARTLEALTPNPAYVIDHRFDIVAWNRAQVALWLDPGSVPAPQRNLVWLMFNNGAVRSLLVDWAGTARMIVAQFRAAAGQHPDDKRFAEIVDDLSATDDEFALWWSSYPVAEFDVTVNRLNHPSYGALQLDLLHLRLAEHPQLTVVLQTPVDLEDARVLNRIVAGQRPDEPASV